MNKILHGSPYIPLVIKHQPLKMNAEEIFSSKLLNRLFLQYNRKEEKSNYGCNTFNYNELVNNNEKRRL